MIKTVEILQKKVCVTSQNRRGEEEHSVRILSRQLDIQLWTENFSDTISKNISDKFEFLVYI